MDHVGARKVSPPIGLLPPGPELPVPFLTCGRFWYASLGLCRISNSAAQHCWWLVGGGVLRCTLLLWRVLELSFEDLPTPAARFGVTQAQGQTEGLQRAVSADLLITYTRNSGGGSLASRLARFLRHSEPPPQFSFGPLPGESRTRRSSPSIRKSGDHKLYIHT